MRKIALLILFTLVYSTAYMQSNGKVEVEHERSLTGAVTKIIYKDSATQQIIKEIAVEDSDLNPYKDLAYPRINDDRFKYAYDLSNEDKYELFDKFLRNSGYPETMVDKLSIKKAIVSPVVSIYHNFRTIEYNLIFENEEDCGVGQIASLFILDSVGSVFKTIYSTSYQMDYIEITNDNKFLAYWSTNPGDIGCYTTIPPTSTVIYDLELQKPILLEQSTKDYRVDGPDLKEKYNYFVFRYNYYNKDGYQYNIIFPHDRIMYSKFYSKNERGRFLRYQHNGIVLKDSIKGEQLDPFEIVFRKTTF